MTGSWAQIGPAMTAAFLASLVEAIEALTIVLAVATVRGWRPAGLGALAGLKRPYCRDVDEDETGPAGRGGCAARRTRAAPTHIFRGVFFAPSGGGRAGKDP